MCSMRLAIRLNMLLLLSLPSWHWARRMSAQRCRASEQVGSRARPEDLALRRLQTYDLVVQPQVWVRLELPGTQALAPNVSGWQSHQRIVCIAGESTGKA